MLRNMWEAHKNILTASESHILSNINIDPQIAPIHESPHNPNGFAVSSIPQHNIHQVHAQPRNHVIEVRGGVQPGKDHDGEDKKVGKVEDIETSAANVVKRCDKDGEKEEE